MRLSVLVPISLVLTSAAGAETLRLPATAQPQSGKTLPLKGAASGAAKASSCGSYGRGFYMVEATGTCVKIGGSISVDTAIRR
ncbi:hypothetical protein [Bradyrhizobium sp. CCBAU 51627]|uniref:hypothetical protein n=1 Tax=Bradyrhizobium sp. CCBAU 51627 TaxID=1325088 RepID=UPI0023056CE3|nr:hypothetical protein [Bradyrhizobium sp. CCBAU 51627]MDA9436075.1 hypothetical protein [Bradyrhizobium sp. CCBAU 51627]